MFIIGPSLTDQSFVHILLSCLTSGLLLPSHNLKMHLGPTGDLCELRNNYKAAKRQLPLATVLETGPPGELRV